jgi:hypothetical protein
MNEQILQGLLNPAVAAVVVGLWILGAFLKRSSVPDKFIIWILLVVSLIACVSILGVTSEAVIQGFIAAAIACFAHQLIKQTAKKE